MSKGSAEVDAARLLPKLVDLVHDSMLQTATASEAMDHRRMTQEMSVLNKRVEEAGALLCGSASVSVVCCSASAIALPPPPPILLTLLCVPL